ncbi:hypothetical protein EDB19DRAFT_1829024 [Suillus lakei]|nr:hypothetical protein EDB19DRAFT_1829024 [Suillus lakei]
MPFIIHDLIPPTVLNAWTVIGELVVLVWHMRIVDTEAYLAPSRDTCKIFSHQDTIKHVATGGYWYDSTIKKWVCTGEKVLCYLDEQPEQARLLGIPNLGHNPPIPGSGKIETTNPTATAKSVRQNAVPWKTTRCAKILGTTQPGTLHYHGKSVVMSEGEHAHLNSHVIFQQPADGKTYIGCI